MLSSVKATALNDSLKPREAMRLMSAVSRRESYSSKSLTLTLSELASALQGAPHSEHTLSSADMWLPHSSHFFFNASMDAVVGHPHLVHLEDLSEILFPHSIQSMSIRSASPITCRTIRLRLKLHLVNVYMVQLPRRLL